MMYPNIDLLAYRFQETLMKNHMEGNKMFIPDTDIYVFPQTWANTAGGFTGGGGYAGQAITKELTTVLINRRENSAMVCFGNRPAYFVTPLTRRFWKDFYKQEMAGLASCGVYNPTDEDYKDMMSEETEDEEDGE